MTFGVMLKGALEDGSIAIVPIETSYVTPDISSLKLEIEKELKMIYNSFPLFGYEIVGLDYVLEKIRLSRIQDRI